jgi:hypothetical protein
MSDEARLINRLREKVEAIPTDEGSDAEELKDDVIIILNDAEEDAMIRYNRALDKLKGAC